jgi:hypothetical protein
MQTRTKPRLPVIARAVLRVISAIFSKFIFHLSVKRRKTSFRLSNGPSIPESGLEMAFADLAALCAKKT